jgi:hypothetical protein
MAEMAVRERSSRRRQHGTESKPGHGADSDVVGRSVDVTSRTRDVTDSELCGMVVPKRTGPPVGGLPHSTARAGCPGWARAAGDTGRSDMKLYSEVI